MNHDQERAVREREEKDPSKIMTCGNVKSERQKVICKEYKLFHFIFGHLVQLL